MEEISMQLLLQIYCDEKLDREQERLWEERSTSGDNKQQERTGECLLHLERIKWKKGREILCLSISNL